MTRPTLAQQDQYLTINRIAKLLGLSRTQIKNRIEQGVFPPPTTFSDGVRLFDEEWLKKAKEKLNATNSTTAS